MLKELAFTQDGCTALMLAVENGSVETVQLLLSNSADPNLCKSDNVSALMRAVEEGNTAIVEALLKAGADASLLDMVILPISMY